MDILKIVCIFKEAGIDEYQDQYKVPSGSENPEEVIPKNGGPIGSSLEWKQYVSSI